MADMDEISYTDSFDDEALIEWDDESSDDESADDEAYFQPRRPQSQSQSQSRQRPRSRQPTRLTKPAGLPARRPNGASSLLSNDRQLAENDKRLAQNDRRLAQGQDRLASKVDEIDRSQDTQLDRLSKFEKGLNQRIKALESSSQMAMLLPMLMSSTPELTSFDTDQGTITVKPGTTKFKDSDGFDPLLLVALSGGMGGSSTGNGTDNMSGGGIFSSPLGLILMLKLLDR